MEPQNHHSYDKAQKRAERFLNNPKKLLNLVQMTSKKAKSHSKKFLKASKINFQTSLRLLKAYANGEYRVIPWKSLSLLTAALVYFLMPLDFLPDFLFSIGLIDDLAILNWTFSRIKKDLDAFAKWEKSKSKKPTK